MTFSLPSSTPRTGAPVDGGVVDLTDTGLPADMTDLIRMGGAALAITAEGAGAAIGSEPPRFLAPGDQVEVSVDGIGTLGNPVR